jgi:collagen type VI alpha
VGPEYFQQVLTFLTQLLDDARIGGGDGMRIGFMTYSTDVTIHFYLGEYKRKEDVLKEIIQAEYLPGSTNTADAILAMRTEMFNTKNGDRKKAPNIAMIISDGISNLNSDRTVTEAIRAHTAGIHVFAVGRCLILISIKL